MYKIDLLLVLLIFDYHKYNNLYTLNNTIQIIIACETHNIITFIIFQVI